MQKLDDIDLDDFLRQFPSRKKREMLIHKMERFGLGPRDLRTLAWLIEHPDENAVSPDAYREQTEQ